MSSRVYLSPTTSSIPTSILDLPIEIRMQIFSCLVQNHSEILISGFNDKHDSQMSLFLTCHTISNDCCELLYGNNQYTLRFADLAPLVRFVKKIGVHNAKRIRKLMMRSNCFHFIKSKPSISRSVTSLCQLLPGIERLELMGIGPDRPGSFDDRASKLWKPSHLKAIEAFTKKAGRLLDGKVFINHHHQNSWDVSAIIYRKNSNLIISRHEIEVDTEKKWKDRADDFRQKRSAWRHRIQA